MSKGFQYKIAAIYDTETSTVENRSLEPDAEAGYTAFPILFIVNDLKSVRISLYEQGKCDDIHYFRYESEMHGYIESLIDWGRANKVVPVIAAYNLMFDLQPLLYWLATNYQCEVNAQSSSNVYTFDLKDGDATLLRFWDTFFLEMGGLKAMGRVAGLPKAIGDWDYDLIRSPETPLTEQELHYAARDVQVIPAYLRYLLDANDFIDESDLGLRVLTKTSIVRKMAEREIGNLEVKTKRGKRLKMLKAFETLCEYNLPYDYRSYALRKACFRGGLTITAGRYASTVQQNAGSLDVTSMHHTFINGRRIFVNFKRTSPKHLQRICESRILGMSRDAVLRNYDFPFLFGVHACCRLTNIRLKAGSAFECYGIACLAEGKFLKKSENQRGKSSEAKHLAENEARKHFRDYAENPVFAFGKLVSADSAVINVSEIELWNVSRVYDFDTFEVLEGEISHTSYSPPDYVTIQSNMLYERKNDAKVISKHYIEGEPYERFIPKSIPDGIAAQLREGSLSNQFFNSWYGSTVKGSFNGIYGTQAQDVYKPSYLVESDGEIKVNGAEVLSEENFEERKPKHCKVLYTYGMRIVGGSRMHLIIAIELLYEHFGERVRVLGGDTDSLKVSMDPGIRLSDLVIPLEPLHMATRKALKKCMKRLRATFPDYASSLDQVGEFDIEPAGPDSDTYEYHYEAWNKARVACLHGKSHITAAGLPRPEDSVTIETVMDSLMAAGIPFSDVAPNVLGYNVTVCNEICHMLNRTHPKPGDSVDGIITDYRGKRAYVSAHQSIALYPSARLLGNTDMFTNACNVSYLQSIGRKLDTEPREIYVSGGAAYISRGVFGDVIMHGKLVQPG